MKKIFKGIIRFITHWIPNLILVAGLVFLIQRGLPTLAFLLIAISKWQVWRGGHKIWLNNLRHNACDLVVAISSVALIIMFEGDLWLQTGIAATYYIWLVLIKPRSGPVGMAVQAGWCQFIGLLAIFLPGRDMPELAVIGLSWLVAMIAADHFLVAHQEPARSLLTLCWGLLAAQFSWLLWRWLIVYGLLGDRLLLPQAVLVITIFGYTFANIYLDHARRRLSKIRLAEYVLLCVGLFIAVIIGTQWDTRL